MSERFTAAEVRRFWTDQAIQHGQSTAASWSDIHVINLENAELVRRLNDGERVLELGCANGFRSVHMASERNVSIKAVDYIPEMIGQAKARQATLPKEMQNRIEFALGDVMSLAETTGSYDAVVSVRVIINLGEWERQARALGECARVLRRGGRLLLFEATVEGWSRLNALRREWDLPDIPMPPYNNYLVKDAVISQLSDVFELEEASNFASTYYVGTRLLKPLLARSLSLSMNIADPLAEWNRFFSRLPAWGDYGTQELLVMRRR